MRCEGFIKKIGENTFTLACGKEAKIQTLEKENKMYSDVYDEYIKLSNRICLENYELQKENHELRGKVERFEQGMYKIRKIYENSRKSEKALGMAYDEMTKLLWPDIKNHQA